MPRKKISDLEKLTIRDALGAVCGIDSSVRELYMDKGLLFEKVAIEKNSPVVGTYIIANPKMFLKQPAVAKSYGLDTTGLSPDAPLDSLDYQLPVIYIADVHPEYGTLGFMLNQESSNVTMSELYPSLRSFRNRPIYAGGIRTAGSSFTMLHRKVGFPENRPFRAPPGEPDKRLFFSPDVAMANELCLTGDASPTDFKYDPAAGT